MKSAIIVYHKNIKKIYEPQWIKNFKDSIESQTINDLPIFEMNYGGEQDQIFEHSYFESVNMPSFINALNYLLDKVFSGGFTAVFNSNCDDEYHPKWIEKTLPYIKAGYDIVSCNFHLMNDDGIYHTHNFERLNIERELSRNHNIICHPGVCYSKAFWDRGNRYVPSEGPYEDLKLWQRSIRNSRFIVIPDHLVYHRVHENSVCKSENR